MFLSLYEGVMVATKTSAILCFSLTAFSTDLSFIRYYRYLLTFCTSLEIFMMFLLYLDIFTDLFVHQFII